MSATSYYTTFCFGSDNKYRNMSYLYNSTAWMEGLFAQPRCDQHGNFTISGDDFITVYNSFSSEEKALIESIYIVKYPRGGISALWNLQNGMFIPTPAYVGKALKRQQNQINEINLSRSFKAETISIEPSYIWQAENPSVIGSKVGHSRYFREILSGIIENHDHSNDRVEGQMFISLSDTQINTAQITCGVGLKSAGYFHNQVDNYVMREWRGQVQCFLQRKYALPTASCAVIIYTRSAYLSDPQMSDEEKERVNAGSGSHFLVALLANAEGVPNVRSPYRLVDCLAGGNVEADQWSLDEIREKAAESMNYATTYSVVAD